MRQWKVFKTKAHKFYCLLREARSRKAGKESHGFAKQLSDPGLPGQHKTWPAGFAMAGTQTVR